MLNKTSGYKNIFKKTNKQYISFWKHWILECLTIALLHYIIGEAIYIISRAITSHIYGVYDPTHPNNPNFLILETSFDRWMPFVKYFIVPYTTAYAYWVIGPFLIYGFMGRKKFYQFILSSIVVNILSVVIFITIPNGIAANFRPVITEQDANKDFFLHMCNWTFTTDSFDQTFPSGHICLSVLIVITFRGTYFKNGVKRLTRTVAWCSLIYALLICTSTLFVKQHYIFDVYVSIFLCEIFMLLFLKWNFLTDKLENFMHWFNSRLGLINDEKNKPFTKYSQKAVLVWIVWLLWIAFTFWAFWETQWFIEEFLLNIGTMLVWVVITFFYYFFRMMKHENQKIN